MPAPFLPDLKTPQGKEQLEISMLTCAQQIDRKLFSYMKYIRPRHAMIVESFGIRGGKIHEVEAMPFVTIPYGLGDGWTEGSGR
jgi:hypothetical protein